MKVKMSWRWSYDLFHVFQPVLIHLRYVQALYNKDWVFIQCSCYTTFQKNYDLNSETEQRIINHVQSAVCSQIYRVNTPSSWLLTLILSHLCLTSTVFYWWFRVVWGWTRLSVWPVSSCSNTRTLTACERRARAPLESRTAPATRGHVYLASTFLLGSVAFCRKIMIGPETPKCYCIEG